MKRVRFYSFGDFNWEGVEVRRYKERDISSFRGVTRRVFVGSEEEPSRFDLRYFELEPGGHTSFEKHDHIHAVIAIRGKGKAIADERVFDMEPFDIIYVGPRVPHQFVNDSDKPFGFFCIVDRVRDRPKPVLEERDRYLENPGIRAVLKIRRQELSE